jgi:uncharacterized LabA/DUF88 family protein
VIASGDADFVPLYKKLREHGITVEVLGFSDSLAKSLSYHVDSVRELGSEILFSNEPHKHEKQPDDEGSASTGRS